MSNQANFKRVFIFDPCFGKMTGHWENYCTRLYDELQKKSYQVKIFGEAHFDKKIVADRAFAPSFDYSPCEIIKHSDDYHHQSQLFLANFRKIKDSQFHDGDLFIFHSIFPQTLSAIVQWTKELVSRKKIISTLFFQFPPAESKMHASALKRFYLKTKCLLTKNKKNNESEWLTNNHVRFYQWTSDELQSLVSSGSHLLFASTEVLSRNFSRMLGAPVSYLPMPGPNIQTQENHPDHYRGIRIGYFGHSSFAKGGQFLRFLVTETLSRFPNAEFILHINPNSETESYLNHFKVHCYPQVKCYFGHLDQEEMMRLMNQVDIILMPYSIKRYATTPSAIFTEGMSLKKLFIIPENSWAYVEAVKYEAGFVSFSKYNRKSILQALLIALENFQELHQKNIEAGKRFYAEHNISNYINQFETILNNRMSKRLSL